MAERAALGFVALLALGALALSLRHPLWEFVQPGPGLFPAIAAGLSAACAVAAMLMRVAREGAAERVEWRRLLVYGAAVLGWCAAFAQIGFAASSFLALAALLRFGEGLRWPLALGFAAITVALGWLLFARLLGVPLP